MTLVYHNKGRKAPRRILFPNSIITSFGDLYIQKAVSIIEEQKAGYKRTAKIS
jgi:hypothetical protein